MSVLFRCLKARPEELHTASPAQLTAQRLVWVLCVMLISACGQSVRAPITDKQVGAHSSPKAKYSTSKASKSRVAPKVYTVVRGDTLQAIAWKFGLNHHEIARWNKIRNANLIYVGQRLKLTAPKGAQTSSQPKKAVPTKRPSAKAKSIKAAKLSWQWPAEGKVTKANSALGARGIEIHGKRGSVIKAAAAGKVVYSGNGLRGYGNLVIIQHNHTYLSAYAHNEKIQVAEGAVVRAGQSIASMGNSGTKQVMLHFEIRRNGKAVEPINYLPRR